MKSRGNSRRGGGGGRFSDNRKDARERSHLKAFGNAHPVNDTETNLKVHIVKEEDDENKNTRRRFYRRNEETEEAVADVEEFVSPFQNLLTDLSKDASENKAIANLKRKLEALRSSKKDTKNGNKQRKDEESEEELDESVGSDEEEDYESSDEGEEDEESEEEGVDLEAAVNTMAQEVLCKDNLETEEKIALDQFTQHFERSLDNKLIDRLKKNLADRSVLNEMEQNIQFTGMGTLMYTPVLEETKLGLKSTKDLDQLNIKQRMLDRMNEAIETVLDKYSVTDGDGQDEPEQEGSAEKKSKYTLEKDQLEILNVISNYADFYCSNMDIKRDSEYKFTYAIHALNHVLKTRSRIIAHNDKLKQSKNNIDVEHRDQGLTRPKVLIIVPFRKCALKLIKTFISLLMRKSEEFVSNKKRFFDSFGPEGDDPIKREEKDAEALNDGEVKKERADDHSFLFTGNVEDHFKIGMSISKKSVKLYTEFYSSDIIIASPLGLKSVIDGTDKDGKADWDFLSSIEVLIVDNADVLMMQNWEHIITVFDHLHLQPKKSHDTDFSRVRNWVLEGQSRFYRQTLIFSRIPAPPINGLFNKYCQNYAGKCQLDLLQMPMYQDGSICKVGFNLAQMFHKIECDSPLDLPDARFNFFIEKILPQYRDSEMMSHTLIFIPSYFDFVKMRNYFKKNDLSSMHCSEYTDKKGIDRARYLFYHNRVHFMLLTERFHFYNRYKIRGITNLIFYELPHYPEYFSNFCNYMPDPKRKTTAGMEDNFTSTVLYSKYDAQKLCGVVGQQRATHMINSDKNVHMFMIDDK